MIKPTFESQGNRPAPMGYSHGVGPAGRVVWTPGQIRIAADYSDRAEVPVPNPPADNIGPSRLPSSDGSDNLIL